MARSLKSCQDSILLIPSPLFRTICLLICGVESFFEWRLSFVLQSRFVTELELGSGDGSLVNQFVVFASAASELSAYLTVKPDSTSALLLFNVVVDTSVPWLHIICL